MEDLFKEQSEYIRVYLGTQIVQDKFEQNVTESLLNPVPIKAVVTDLSPSQLQWKMPGIVSSGAKELIIEAKREDLIKLSRRFKIRGEFYYGWQNQGQMSYRKEGNYIRLYVYKKKES